MVSPIGATLRAALRHRFAGSDHTSEHTASEVIFINTPALSALLANHLPAYYLTAQDGGT
jgi:hypothetical protein